ncbi:Qat anti-phage system QueC-like protein QatC [Sedimentibacter sp.]|uniref:Qat anti-phage system QueC-like protein QatC n=1 Tax=Sedimentibacter sp. TaxID=1960295 RepID=UPI002899FFF5|nr:Qat anti-phage system QueC-like protein QatC [Sedimentibacter sp.]
MNRFKLIGKYDSTDLTSFFDGDLEIVNVPLITEKGMLCYGIGNVIEKMLDNKICPTEDGIDIMVFATLVYLADTRISRSIHSQDSWTREIEIQLPVINLETWNASSEDLTRMLDFLTGDKWSIIFEQRDKDFDDLLTCNEEQEAFEVVSLFSGGMDSLISTVNYLEDKKNVVLISHAGDGFTKNAQTNILKEFKEMYPEIMPLYLDLWMSFEKEFIPHGGTENTTRSRSFLFISFGVFAISGVKGVNRLEVPENGLIALNVPLDNLRVGSHSTRTTHPFYLEMWNKVLGRLGFNTTVENPYWDKTKGEMADKCKNKEFLSKVIKKSISCSSPVKAKWKKLPPQHCGYCVPCLIRRAAMQKAFGLGKDCTDYTQESTNAILKDHANAVGSQLRSFQLAINRIKKQPNISKVLIHKPGPLKNDAGYLDRLAGVYTRGLLEVDDFINGSLVDEVQE